MQIVDFVTSNSEKVKWVNGVAEKYNYQLRFEMYKYDFEEGRSTDVEDVVKKKVTSCMEVEKRPFIVEDSGFFIDALNGFPSTFVKFGLSTIGINGILKLTKDIDDEKRTYSIRSAIGYGDPISKRSITVISSSTGKLSRELTTGNYRNWGDIMGLIIPEGYKTTIAQFDDEKWQHYKYDTEKGDAFTVSIGKILKIINGEHV